MSFEILNPAGWRAPKGYANVIAIKDADRIVFVAGQIAWDAEQRLVGAGDFPAQFRQVLANVVACVRSAGGEPQHLAQMTIYVTDKGRYLAAQSALGTIWKEVVGRHWPTMALVEVAALLEPEALVEIQAIACLPR